jgi:cytochrome c551/c552
VKELAAAAAITLVIALVGVLVLPAAGGPQFPEEERAPTFTFPARPERPLEELEGAELGQALVRQMGCLGCHTTTGERSVGPTWHQLFDKTVPLADGTTVVADEAYLRESIVDPNAKIVEGFPPDIMPGNYDERLTDEEVGAIVEYIKTLQ